MRAIVDRVPPSALVTLSRRGGRVASPTVIASKSLVRIGMVQAPEFRR